MFSPLLERIVDAAVWIGALTVPAGKALVRCLVPATGGYLTFEMLSVVTEMFVSGPAD